MKLKKLSGQHFPGRIIRWKDGDTALVVIELGFNVSLEITARLAGMESWELRADPRRSRNFTAPVDKARAQETRDRLNAVFTDAQVIFTPTHQHPDLYGRWIGDLTHCGDSIAEYIRENNLGWRPDRTETSATTENDAIKSP